MNSKLIWKFDTGPLPTSEFDLIVSGKKVGFLQLRHKPSAGEDIPSHMASHMYYEINETEQRKGYGNLILKLGIKEARNRNFKEIILTVNEDNTPSRKIIENSGGILIDKAKLADGKMFLKYKINLENTAV